MNATHRVLERLTHPAKIWSRAELAQRCENVPEKPGVNAWWFDAAIGSTPQGVVAVRRFRLLYVGATNNLQRRIEQHFDRTARQSTLRLSLGSLLREELRLVVRPMRGNKQDFGDTEDRLSAWIAVHSRVSWLEATVANSLKAAALDEIVLPLNIRGARAT